LKVPPRHEEIEQLEAGDAGPDNHCHLEVVVYVGSQGGSLGEQALYMDLKGRSREVEQEKGEPDTVGPAVEDLVERVHT
jgi:hypothetical protein